MASNLSRRAILTAGAAAAAGAVSQAALAQNAGGKPIRILGIATSFRKGKNTAAGVQAALDAAKEVSPSIEVELIELAGLKLHPEIGAGIVLEPGEKDDFPAIQAKLADPKTAGIIIGSPCYFANMSSLCKAFLECMMPFKKSFELRNKVAGCLAVGGARNGGHEVVLQSLRAALAGYDIIVVGDGKPISHMGGTLWADKGDATKDEWGMTTVKNMGKRVAEVALMLTR
jgi:multimeric flavodoxin WrbA